MLVLGVVSVLVVAAILFLWIPRAMFGLGKGRRYGNRVAAHLGWSNNFFHSVLESGMPGAPTLMILAGMGDQKIEQSTLQLAPTLARGLVVLEERFGRQQQIEDAKPTVQRLLEESTAIS
jgi:hypothetical protein